MDKIFTFFTQFCLVFKYISHKIHHNTYREIFKELHVLNFCMYSYEGTNVKDV